MNASSKDVEHVGREIAEELDGLTRRLRRAIIVSSATSVLLAGALGFVAGSLP